MVNFAFFDSSGLWRGQKRSCFISYVSLWLRGYKSIMQNKPNLSGAEINTISVFTKDYKVFMLHESRKNKANSKPISVSRPTPKEREDERGLEIISNPDTIRAEPKPFGSIKAASNIN